MKGTIARTVIFLLLVISTAALASCKTATRAPSGQDDFKLTVYYEGVFVDDDQAVIELAKQMRGENTPFEKESIDFHVTVFFEPQEPFLEKLGTPVDIVFTGYARKAVDTEEYGTVYAEAFKVDLVTDDQELQAYIDKSIINWHITCSYSHIPRYSGHIDFSDALPVNVTLSGVYGAYLGDGVYAFNQEELAQAEEVLKNAAEPVK